MNGAVPAQRACAACTQVVGMIWLGASLNVVRNPPMSIERIGSGIASSSRW